jgi:hypothetical protein
VERPLKSPERTDWDTSVGPRNCTFDFVNVDARPWRRMRPRFAVAISRQAITPGVVSAFCKSHDSLRRSVNVCYHKDVFVCV